MENNEIQNEIYESEEVVTHAVQVVAPKELSVNLSETAKTNYSSIKGDSREEKARLFKAKSNPDKRLADCINQKIYVKDLYMEVVTITNDETGEVQDCPRVVLLDKDGISYTSVSFGVYNSLRSLVAVYGEPTWEEPIPIIVRQKETGKNRKQLVLDVDVA